MSDMTEFLAAVREGNIDRANVLYQRMGAMPQSTEQLMFSNRGDLTQELRPDNSPQRWRGDTASRVGARPTAIDTAQGAVTGDNPVGIGAIDFNPVTAVPSAIADYRETRERARQGEAGPFEMGAMAAAIPLAGLGIGAAAKGAARTGGRLADEAVTGVSNLIRRRGSDVSAAIPEHGEVAQTRQLLGSADSAPMLHDDGDMSMRTRKRDVGQPIADMSLDERREEVYSALRETLDEMNLTDVSLAVPDRITVPGPRGNQDVAGQYRLWRDSRPLIEVALTAAERPMDYDSMYSVVHHEAIHAMRNMRLFSPQEWNVLQRASEKEWLKKHDIMGSDLYKTLPKPKALEEGIAREFEQWATSESRDTESTIGKIFYKMQQFFEKLRNVVIGRGWNSVDSIFGDAASGEIGKRARMTEGQDFKASRTNYDPMYSDAEAQTREMLNMEGQQ